MKKPILLLILLAAAVPLAFPTPDHPPAKKPAAPAAPDAAWFAHAKAHYPLKTCVVSGDEFGGGMGAAIDYVYQQDGKPDRLVRFCCKDCRKDFDADPAKFLKLIDEAATKATKK